MTRRDPMEIALCGWGRCAERTDGFPICEKHLRKAWAIVQARLTEEQQHAVNRA